jgi:hypothetical protein
MLVKDKEIANLINAGAKLDENIKALTKEFKAIKDELKDKLDKGTYVTSKGRALTISCSKKYSDIQPEKAKEALRKKRLGRNFMHCVKVNLTELRKLLTDADIKNLRVAAGSIVKMSFK